MRIQKYEIIRMKNSNTKSLPSAFMAQMESSDDLWIFESSSDIIPQLASKYKD